MKLLCFAVALCLVTLYACAATANYIVIQNEYVPKPGTEKEVYKLRVDASHILATLGLPTGRILRQIKTNNKPYVMWECDYHSIKEAAH